MVVKGDEGSREAGGKFVIAFGWVGGGLGGWMFDLFCSVGTSYVFPACAYACN